VSALASDPRQAGAAGTAARATAVEAARHAEHGTGEEARAAAIAARRMSRTSISLLQQSPIGPGPVSREDVLDPPAFPKMRGASTRAGDPSMPQIEVRLNGWRLGDALAELLIWFDHNQYVPENFELSRLPGGDLLIRVAFSDNAMAEAFEREFAR
jgi:hypothetical protein